MRCYTLNEFRALKVGDEVLDNNSCPMEITAIYSNDTCEAIEVGLDEDEEPMKFTNLTRHDIYHISKLF